MTPGPCPPREHLERLLAEQLDAAADAELSRHVDACPACQAALDEMSGGTTREAPLEEGPAADSVEGVIRRLKARGPQEAGATLAWPAPRPALPRVPGYEVLEEVGRGGMGVIYRARDEGLNRVVALKMIGPGRASDAKALVRLRAEAAAVARLQHPNIVQIFEVGEHDGLPYLSLEFVPGGSLRQQLDGTPWPARRAAELVEVVARAVDAAHERGIVHRDLKPANILLSAPHPPAPSPTQGRGGDGAPVSPLPPWEGGLGSEGVPKVADFGLAKLLDGSGAPGGPLTHSGEVVGTPAYMAPEQARGDGQAIGPAVDVYALGAILYEMLTGRPPFTAETPLETLLRVVHEEPVSVSRLRPGAPRDLATIAMKCLEKQPAGRYPGARALADDLARFLDGRPILTRPVGRLERLGRWCRRNPAVAALAAAVALALVAGTAASTYFALKAGARARDAEENAQRADARADEAQAHLYAVRMNLAQGAWRDAQGRRALDLLELCVPRHAGEKDRRGWEWRHQWRLCHDEVRAFSGHDGWVYRLAFSADGTRLASGSADRTARLWDVATGRELRTFKGHTAGVEGVALSPDGTRLATASHDGTVKVWDAAGRELHTLKGHRGAVVGVAFSPDGARLASAGNDWTVRLWDAADGRPLRTLWGGHLGKVWCLAFSPDGASLASGGTDGRVHVWGAADGRRLRAFAGHAGAVSGVAFSPDGRRLATATFDHTARVWDAATGRVLHTLEGHGNWVYAVAFSPDGRELASAGWDQTVRLWDAETGRQTRVLRGHINRVHGVAFHPEGNWLASGGVDGTVRLWDAASGPAFRALAGHAGGVHAVAFGPGGRLASAGDDRTLRVWDAAGGPERLALRGHTAAVARVAFSPDGLRLASAGHDGAVRLWDAAAGRELRVLRGHAGAVQGAAFSPDGERLASAGDDRTVKVWDAAAGRELRTLRGHAAGVAAVAFSPDGARLASAGHDGTARLWDAEDGRELAVLRGHQAEVRDVAFSPDGRLLASASGRWESSGEIKLWDVAAGEEVRSLADHEHVVYGVAFSPDGTRLASAGADEVVKVWDVGSGQVVWSGRVKGTRFTGVAFSPEGDRLAASGWDRTVRVWDARPLTPRLRGEREAVGLVGFLLARPLSRADAREHLAGSTAIRPAVRDKALALLGGWPEETGPEAYYRAGWAAVLRPYLNPAQYGFALRQAETACRLAPNEGKYQLALGAAQHRAGRHAQARDTLTRAVPLTGGSPAGLTFLAMAQMRLGQAEQARATLARLPRAGTKPWGPEGEAAEALRREAEGLLGSPLRR
jgi:WD40 repeat protein/serine/threonine protein kinase